MKAREELKALETTERPPTLFQVEVNSPYFSSGTQEISLTDPRAAGKSAGAASRAATA